jgi:hypothetical protein
MFFSLDMATSNTTETKPTPASILLSNAQIIKVGENGQPTVYKLQTTEEILDGNLRLRKCYVGQAGLVNGCPEQEKIIMVVGATGAGKSTMINAFVNYFYGTQWNDSFRLKLITEEDEGINGIAKSQTKSQTRSITAYTLHYQEGCQVPYTLTIIDTPGFGDVEGIKRDEEITKQIREFFMIKGPNGIDHLDAIGFVVQSSLGRLTPTQKYIFDSILSIFGKDIASNMFSLITFADGQPPPVLEAIKEAAVPSITHFKFNNSALYAVNQSEDGDEEEGNIDGMFWKIGVGSLKKFFLEFQKVKPVSLVLTKEVLTERQHLEAFVQGIQPQIKLGLHKLEVLRQETRILEDHAIDIEKNKSFTYTVNVPKHRTVNLPKGQFVTNCLRCNRTCHYPCTIAKDDEKYLCAAMNVHTTAATCIVCPDKCSWNSHVNNTYQFELYQEKETRTIEDMKKRYQQATQDGKTKLNIFEALKNDFQETQKEVCRMIGRARQAIVRLDEIALRPNPLSTIQYIELIIETEKNEAKPGWQDRIRHLNDAKQKAQIIEKVKTTPDNDWFGDTSDVAALDDKFRDLAGKIEGDNSESGRVKGFFSRFTRK